MTVGMTSTGATEPVFDTAGAMRADRPATADAQQRQQQHRRRRVWPWLLGALLVLAGLALLAAAFGATALLGAIDPDVLSDLDITINGEAWNPARHGAPAWASVLALGGALFGAMLAVLLVVLVVVPAVLMLVLGAGALAIGTVLLALLLVAALALSPLWLVVLVLWLALRRKPVVPTNADARMAA